MATDEATTNPRLSLPILLSLHLPLLCNLSRFDKGTVLQIWIKFKWTRLCSLVFTEECPELFIFIIFSSFVLIRLNLIKSKFLAPEHLSCPLGVLNAHRIWTEVRLLVSVDSFEAFEAAAFTRTGRFMGHLRSVKFLIGFLTNCILIYIPRQNMGVVFNSSNHE